jgi:DNA-binding response OmpR family regulator
MTAEGESGTEGAQVLIVDDEEELADLYALWLADSYDVQAVYSGSAALECLEQSPDVILLDRLLPDISGAEVLDYISNQHVDVKVAILTAMIPDFDILEMEFDTYLTKPVARSELCAVVDSLLSISEHEDQIQEYCALVGKRSALKSNVPAPELETNDDYNALQNRISQFQIQNPEMLEEVGVEDYLGLMWDPSGDRMETD